MKSNSSNSLHLQDIVKPFSQTSVAGVNHQQLNQLKCEFLGCDKYFYTAYHLNKHILNKHHSNNNQNTAHQQPNTHEQDVQDLVTITTSNTESVRSKQAVATVEDETVTQEHQGYQAKAKGTGEEVREDGRGVQDDQKQDDDDDDEEEEEDMLDDKDDDNDDDNDIDEEDQYTVAQSLQFYDECMNTISKHIERHPHLKPVQKLHVAHILALYQNQDGIKEKRELDKARQELLTSELETTVSRVSGNNNIHPPKQIRSNNNQHNNHNVNNMNTSLTVFLRLGDGTTNSNSPISNSPHFYIKMQVDTTKSITQNIQDTLEQLKQQHRIHTTPKPARDTTELTFHIYPITHTQEATNSIKHVTELRQGDKYILSHDMTTVQNQQTTLFIHPNNDNFTFAYIQLPLMLESIKEIHMIVQEIFKIQYNITYHTLNNTSIVALITHQKYTRIITKQLKRGRPSNQGHENAKHKNDDLEYQSTQNAKKKPRGRPPKLHKHDSKHHADDDDNPSDDNDSENSENENNAQDRSPKQIEQQNLQQHAEDDDVAQPPSVKKKRGRPSKSNNVKQHQQKQQQSSSLVKRPRGRPPKAPSQQQQRRPRGRPPKITQQHDQAVDEEEEEGEGEVGKQSNIMITQQQTSPLIKRQRGRPRKTPIGSQQG